MALGSSIGLVSGLDFNAIIARAQRFSARPLAIMQNKVTRFNAQTGAFQALNLRLDALQNSLRNLNDASDFSSRNASSSNTDILTATATATAAEGTYDVTVKQLAKNSRRASQGVADTDQTSVVAADGVLGIKLGVSGTLKSIAVDAGMTLDDLRAAINDADIGVRASIVNDGSSTNPYRLVLSSEGSGSDNKIVINPIYNDTTLDFNNTAVEAAVADSGNTFNGTLASGGTYTGTTTANVVIEVTTAGDTSTAQYKVSFDGGLTWGADNEFTASESPVDVGQGVTATFTAAASPVDLAVGDRFTIDAFAPLLQEAQDAIVEVDGIQVTRGGNSVSGVIDGVTLNLLSADIDQTVTVSIRTENNSVAGPVNAFVTNYNALINDMNALSEYDVDTGVAQVLFGDSTVRGIRDSLQNIVISQLGAGSGLNSLGAIGITTQADGTLAIDSDKLTDAIENNFEELLGLFTAAGNSTSDEVSFNNATAIARSGRYNIEVNRVAEQAVAQSNQAVDIGGITNAETLTFTIDSKTLTINFDAGDTLAEIIDQINNRMSDEGIGIRAMETSAGSGILKIYTEDYGSVAAFTVVSDRDGAVSSQLGIGTTKIEAEGVDVSGRINGQLVEGNGRLMTGGEGTDAQGLSFMIKSTTTGSKGYVEVALGAAHLMDVAVDRFTNAGGLIQARVDGIEASTEDVNDQIEGLRARLDREANSMRQKFAGLETLIAQYQAQQAFLTQQLSQIASMNRR